MTTAIDHLPDHVRAACSVTERGWPVLALHIGTKKPLHRGSMLANHRDHWLTSCEAVVIAWEEADDPLTLQRGCQFAVMTGVPNADGECLVVLDADVNGDWSKLDELLIQAGPAAIDWAAATMQVKRSDDRAHLVGTAPVGDCPPTAVLVHSPPDGEGKRKPLIEWRGEGGYVLLPGAKHPSGERYRVSRAAEPKVVPTALRALARANQPVAAAPRTAVTPDSEPPPPGDESAWDRVLAALDGRFGRVIEQADGTSKVIAHCPGPAHRDGDRNASLSLKREVDGQVLVHCHTVGCRTEDMLAAVGLTMADLFDRPIPGRVEPADNQVLPASTDNRVPPGFLVVEGVLVPEQPFMSLKDQRLMYKLADRAANDEIEAAEVASAPDKLLAGDEVFRLPGASPILGRPDAPLTGAGQGTLVAGPDGTGKSTFAQHYAKARLGLPGWGGTMLGEPVVALPSDQTVLYLAADRPIQILQGFQRGITEADVGAELRARLKFWPGPPPLDLATNAGRLWLLRLIELLNVGLLIFDSRKDFGDELDPREVSRLNRLFKQLDADGVETLTLHHPVQKANKHKPQLTDVMGYRAVYSGMGSVLMLEGTAGANVVTLHQVKPLLASHPAIRIRIDKGQGRLLWDPIAVPVPSATGGRPDSMDVDLTGQPDQAAADPRREELRALFTALPADDGWVLASALKKATGADRLGRLFAGFEAKDGGPIESNQGRGPQSAYRWVEPGDRGQEPDE